MPIRDAGSRRNAWGCFAALVCTAIVFQSPSAVGQGPDTAPRRESSPDGTLVDRLTIVLRVDNVARLRDSELEAAQALGTAIFRTAGLESMWFDSRAPTRASMQMWVVLGSADRSERMIARLRGPADLLGMAPPGSRRVYIFSDRIRQYAALKKRSFEEVLGHVRAHEIGHQLLLEHGDTGIMRADIGDAFSTPWFTGRQLRSIHSSLSDAQARVWQGRAESRRMPGR